jgi:hypothetical protein
MRRTLTVVLALSVLAVAVPAEAVSERRQRLHHWRSGSSVKKNARGYEMRIEADGSTCKLVQAHIQGENVFGAMLFRTNMSMKFCWRFGRITRVETNVWPGAPSWSLWRWNGVANRVQGGDRDRVYRRVHAHWSIAIAGYGVHSYPWISLTGHAGGGWSDDSGH